MVTALFFIPYIIASLLAAAHFLRYGNMAGVVFCLLLPFTAFYRSRKTIYFLQGMAATGSLLWIFTTWSLVQQRLSMGRPYSRLLIILFAVALFTLFSGLLLNHKKLKESYK